MEKLFYFFSYALSAFIIWIWKTGTFLDIIGICAVTGILYTFVFMSCTKVLSKNVFHGMLLAIPLFIYSATVVWCYTGFRDPANDLLITLAVSFIIIISANFVRKLPKQN